MTALRTRLTATALLALSVFAVGCGDKEVDEDGDGFATDQDCDDTNPAIHPSAAEVCDGVDNDCDGEVDGGNATDAYSFFADADGDGYGDADTPVQACELPHDAADQDGDCDDTDAAVNPGVVELCSTAVDDDCDGQVNEADADDVATWYTDADADGYGADEGGVEACEAPSATVSQGGDCDDGDTDVNPGAVELCSTAVDDDCDGEVNEGDAADATPWFEDWDADGYGDPGVEQLACEAPDGYAGQAGDCDDLVAEVNPGAMEVCDGQDNDCDGTEPQLLVTHWDSSGAAADVSSTFTAGSSSQPAVITISDPGTYAFCEGTYHVALAIDADDVVMEGVHGPDLTVLSGADYDQLISIVDQHGLEFRGLTLAEGFLASNTERGGALFAEGSTMLMDDVIVRDNYAGLGGGIYILDGSDLTVTDSVMQNNEAHTGGGAFYSLSSTLTFSNVELSDNTCLRDGGAGAVFRGSFDVTNGSFSGNVSTAAYGGALDMGDRAAASFTGTTFTNNTADVKQGGAIAMGTGGMTLVGVSFTGNSSLAGGGAIYASSTGTTVSVTTSDFASNTPDDVETRYADYTWGTGASFTCASGYCQ